MLTMTLVSVLGPHLTEARGESIPWLLSSPGHSLHRHRVEDADDEPVVQATREGPDHEVGGPPSTAIEITFLRELSFAHVDT